MRAGCSTAHAYDDESLIESSKVPAAQPVIHAGRSTAHTYNDESLIESSRTRKQAVLLMMHA